MVSTVGPSKHETHAWINSNLCKHFVGLKERTKKWVFRNARRLPFVAQKIATEVNKQRQELAEHFHKSAKGQTYIQRLPDVGLTEVKYKYWC